MPARRECTQGSLFACPLCTPTVQSRSLGSPLGEKYTAGVIVVKKLSLIRMDFGMRRSRCNREPTAPPFLYAGNSNARLVWHRLEAAGAGLPGSIKSCRGGNTAWAPMMAIQIQMWMWISFA
jgi:hypothetical protein